MIQNHQWRHLAATLAAILLLNMTALVFTQWPLFAAEQRPAEDVAALVGGGVRDNELMERWSRPTITPYISPAFEQEMLYLKPTILAAAARHNVTELSKLDDQQFAVVLAQILYSERVGWLDARFAAFRPLQPAFQQLQTAANGFGGADLTIWPSNLRPSVALEILTGRVPLPPPTRWMRAPISVYGTTIHPNTYWTRIGLYAAISRELNEPTMAVEYLAANLERGIYRAHAEGVPVTWQTLATWHNQGIVAPRDIRTNPQAIAYLGRTAAYLPHARRLIEN